MKLFESHKEIVSSFVCGGLALALYYQNYERKPSTALNEQQIQEAIELGVRERTEGLVYALSDFLRRKCSVTYINLGLVPSVKELTESLATVEAIRNHLSDVARLDDPDVTAVVIGDGMTPRTGALLSLYTHWEIHTIDPIMKTDEKYNVAGNLAQYPCIVQDVMIRPHSTTAPKVVLILVHCHVTLPTALNCLLLPEMPCSVSIVTCPCCQFVKLHPTLFDEPADVTYVDPSILSNKNRFFIYKNVEEQARRYQAEKEADLFKAVLEDLPNG